MISSQFFGAPMNFATQLLETEGGGRAMHTFQVCIDCLPSMDCITPVENV